LEKGVGRDAPGNRRSGRNTEVGEGVFQKRARESWYGVREVKSFRGSGRRKDEVIENFRMRPNEGMKFVVPFVWWERWAIYVAEPYSDGGTTKSIPEGGFELAVLWGRGASPPEYWELAAEVYN